MPETTTTEAAMTFQNIWKNYPNNDPCVNPKTGKKVYDDQCAIRIGMALEKSGADFRTFHGPRCEFGTRGNGMVLRAEELAAWLRAKPFASCPTALVIDGKGFQKNLIGRTGIIFFKDYWARETDRPTSPTGDHIDLWNRDRLTPSRETFLRFTLGISRMPNLNPFGRGNWYSDLENSRQVIFWDFP